MPMQRPTLNASDVVFMTAPRNEALYDAYAGTVVGWAGRAPSRQPQHLQWFRQQVEKAKQRNLRYCGNVDFVVDFGGFIDFRPNTFMEAVCRDLDGNPITVPWLWDHQHKGHPAYWFCTNNPDYQAYLRDQVERACVAPIDGLHIDDWRGTAACSGWHGGCFCRYCKEGFREWLRQKLSPEQLNALGITDLDRFDVQAFLKAKGITAEQWRRQRAQLPLGDLFQQFQTERMNQVVRSVFEYAEQLMGRPLLRSVNSSASSPEAIAIAPLIDYFCGEMDHHAATGEVPLEPAFVYRLVEGLGKRQAATASGYDWAWIAANEKPGLVRTWIAQAYAFGSLFMVPHNQWCYTPEKGTHWWQGKTEDFAFVYQFVRRNAELFDGYRSLASIALVYTHANFPEIRSAALSLLEANVPFAIVIAEPELRVSLSQADLAPYDQFYTGSHPLPAHIEQLLRAKRLDRWQGLENLPSDVRRQVVVEGSPKVRVSVRYQPNNPTAPIVCHLLNTDYDLATDTVRPAEVTVVLHRSLLKRASAELPTEAIVHQPNQPTQKVPVQRSGDSLRFPVRLSSFWGLVALQ